MGGGSSRRDPEIPTTTPPAQPSQPAVDEAEFPVNADLTNRQETILHVATQANQVHFVNKLVNMSEADMEMLDVNGNTAFQFAAASGNTKIVEIMERRNPRLRTIRGSGGIIPLQVAALQGRSEIAKHLKSADDGFHNVDDLRNLLFCCVNSGIYGK
ncbi:uncharacterized protein LOC129305425 [Prosopis cineraria]|uniref:uncharacterized protein LOC129305425 n=1 Tax=Prosopis cineraria TaxID=364024 RepID=UPI002410A93B|nr:uncharacterized protein LOC129305425 [Prosopis cineraria]